MQEWEGIDDDDPLLASPRTPLLPHGRAYLLGLLAAAAGDRREALAWADSVERTPEPARIEYADLFTPERTHPAGAGRARGRLTPTASSAFVKAWSKDVAARLRR